MENTHVEKLSWTPRSKAIFAHVAGRKGLCTGLVHKIVGDLDQLGYRKLVMRSDQEPSILRPAGGFEVRVRVCECTFLGRAYIMLNVC